MKATLTIGDWSQDGHNITDTVQIEIPETLQFPAHTKPEWPQRGYGTWGCSDAFNLWGYYQLAVSQGVPDITKLCKGYEDSEIPRDVAELFINDFGVELEDGLDEDSDDPVYISSDDYASIWVAIVNKGIELHGESARVTIVPNDNVTNFNIGGYGLFCP